MPTIPEIKVELKALKVKGITGKNKAELMAMLQKAKAVIAPKVEKTPERIVMKLKKKVKITYLDAEEYLRKLVMIKIADDEGNDDNTEEILEKIEEKGDYNEYQQDAIESFGGEEEVVRKMVNYYKKKGLSVSQIVKLFRNVDEGYSMFDDYIAENSKKASTKGK